MRRLEVRCTQDPDKVQGWLPVPANKIVPGIGIRFVVMQRPGAARLPAHVDLEVHRFLMCGLEHTTDTSTGQCIVALKSDGLTIEALRRIPGFIEVGVAGLQP